jgi:hypothetical protein
VHLKCEVVQLRVQRLEGRHRGTACEPGSSAALPRHALPEGSRTQRPSV